MTPREKQLLGNVLDALDRLFDWRSSALDLWALLFATAEALRGTPHHGELEKATQALRLVIRSGDTQEAQRDCAMEETDCLRLYLARLLPVES